MTITKNESTRLRVMRKTLTSLKFLKGLGRPKGMMSPLYSGGKGLPRAYPDG